MITDKAPRGMCPALSTLRYRVSLSTWTTIITPVHPPLLLLRCVRMDVKYTFRTQISYGCSEMQPQTTLTAPDMALCR